MRDALILAGGLGTRLGSLTAEIPKPLLDVGGVAFIDHVQWNLARHGVERAVVSVGYLAEVFETHFATTRVPGIEVTLVVEDEPLGTGGAMALAAQEVTGDEVLVLNGDTLFDLNYLDLAVLRRSEDVPVAVALRAVPDAARYGAVELAGSRIARFAEKTAAGAGLVSGGVYAASVGFLRGLPLEPHSFERAVMPTLAADGRLAGREYAGWFVDIGTPESIESARDEIAAWRDKPMVLLDRDGVVNVDHGHVATPERFDWMPGAVDAIKLINDAGALVVVVTNQAGIAKGYYTESEYLEFRRWIERQLADMGAHLDATYHCPHHPEGRGDYRAECACRKPAPGMIVSALAEFGVDPKRAVLIGDKESDVEAAAAAGVRGVLLGDAPVLPAVRDALAALGVA
jgi:D-glycero-D-manno-heptose 1,7-bisphosphate phosphatase